MDPDQEYAERARMEAIRMEEDRKLRQASDQNPNHLPGFQPYETVPLTSSNPRGDQQWLEEEEEDVGTAAHQGYRDQPERSYAMSTVGSESGSFAQGGFNAGRGAGGGGLDQEAAYGQPGGIQRRSSDGYAAGQATPGGYPPTVEDGGCKCPLS